MCGRTVLFCNSPSIFILVKKKKLENEGNAIKKKVKLDDINNRRTEMDF